MADKAVLQVSLPRHTEQIMLRWFGFAKTVPKKALPGLLWLLTGSTPMHHLWERLVQSLWYAPVDVVTFLIAALPLIPVLLIIGALGFHGAKVSVPCGIPAWKKEACSTLSFEKIAMFNLYEVKAKTIPLSYHCHTCWAKCILRSR